MRTRGRGRPFTSLRPQGRRGLSEPLELFSKELVGDRRGSPWQWSLWGWVIEIAWHDMNMQVRHDIAQQQVVHMTGAEDALDRYTNSLDVLRVVGKLIGGKSGEVSDVSTTKDNGHMTFRNGVPFKYGLADSAAVE
jgi:hypothetical protein